MDSSLNTTLEYFKTKLEGIISKQPRKAKKETEADLCTRTDLKNVLWDYTKEFLDYIEEVKKDAKEKIELVEKNAKERDEAKDKVIDSLQDKLLNNRLELEKSQQYQNRDSFKICGIKKPLGTEHEDTAKTVMKFFETANAPLPQEELSMTHRVPSRDTTRSDALLVKLRSRIVRNKYIRMKKDFRDNELLKSENPDAFIVEHLTPLRAKVCYKLRHDENIEKCWTIDGRIKIVKKGADSSEKPITIDSLAQLTKLGAGWTKKDIEKLVFEA